MIPTLIVAALVGIFAIWMTGCWIIATVDLTNTRRDLEALRANCFLTNERGHRVRWAKASAAVQAKAEGRA
jgi:hypothetical protein